MGGPGAPDQLRLGHLTQTWLAVSDHPRRPRPAEATKAGGYWYHLRRPIAGLDEGFQDAQLDELTLLTSVRVP
jgi:hypothetical protein